MRSTFYRSMFAYTGSALALQSCARSSEHDSDVANRLGALVAQNRSDVAGFVQSENTALLDVKGGTGRSGGGTLYTEKDGALFALAANGWSTTLLSAKALSERETFRGTIEEHNSKVSDLLKSAGIPTEQLGPVGALVVQRLPAASKDDEQRNAVPPAEVSGYISRMERRIDGIKVPDSFFVLALDANAQPIAESVFWPALPGNVLDEARVLRDRLSNPNERAAFLAAHTDLSQRAGEVVIRHSPAAFGGAFEAHAVYDVAGEGAQVERHFGANGEEVTLQTERSTASPNAADPSAASWRPDSSCKLLDSQWRLPALDDSAILVTGDGQWAYMRAGARIEGRLSPQDDSTVVIVDSGALGLEPCPTGSEGTYRLLWRESCQEMQLLVLKDECVGRRQALGGLALARSGK